MANGFGPNRPRRVVYRAVMSVPREGRIDLETVSLSTLEWGPRGGPLALCLHGYPDTAWTWRHLGPALGERGWRVIAPFTRGYAPSSIPSDGSYHIGALMDDAVGIHTAVDADDSAVLIGHDWGSVTSNGLAAHRDSPFGRVVSMAVPPAPAFVPRRSPSELLAVPRLLATQLPRSWYMLFNQLPRVPERSLDRLIPHLWRRWSPGYDAGEDLEHVAAALKSTASRTAALGYYRAALRPFPRPPARYRHWQSALLQAPTVPMLYLHGDDDGCMTPRYADRVQAALPAGSRVARIPRAGHFLHLEQPETVNRLVLDFVGEG
ncbi:Pimeloyl-ACP methyl ester carboxylesterase [Rhodococcus tukisamuensis]|uniref:Pimeloyl-ACP methyl ester carboxylesterase n=2 Tax=Rhodococcus tukisamuensis TaxID=168276 RepID=A0A1G6SGA9_9NOCA|nr:Pimeloyl-ACP methyl ester carboxylesterase [Rhodococcus tukisamuensis]